MFVATDVATKKILGKKVTIPDIAVSSMVGATKGASAMLAFYGVQSIIKDNDTEVSLF